MNQFDVGLARYKLVPYVLHMLLCAVQLHLYLGASCEVVKQLPTTNILVCAHHEVETDKT